MCPARVRASTPRAAKSRSTLPTAWEASVCRRGAAAPAAALAARTALHTAATSLMAPVSLLASITDTRKVSLHRAAHTASGVTLPSLPGATRVTRMPRWLSTKLAACTAATCSVAPRMRCPPPTRPRLRPLMMWLMDSVAQLSKITLVLSQGARSREHSWPRACARAAWAGAPKAVEGLPNCSVKKGRAAASASGLQGVVPLASR